MEIERCPCGARTADKCDLTSPFGYGKMCVEPKHPFVERHKRQTEERAQWVSDYAQILRQWQLMKVQESIVEAERVVYHARDEGGELMYTPIDYYLEVATNDD